MSGGHAETEFIHLYKISLSGGVEGRKKICLNQ